MQVIKLQCPNCKADLSVDSSRERLYCEYCGQEILLNDDVARSEHTENINITYRQVDEALIKEAEVELKKLEQSATSNREKVHIKNKHEQNSRGCCIALLVVPFLLILIITVIGYIRNSVDNALENSIKKHYSSQISQINEICEKHDASISDTSFGINVSSIDVSVNTCEKKKIDALQKELVSTIDVMIDHSLSVNFKRSEQNTIRKVKIEENGMVDVKNDYTNIISDKQMNLITKEYRNALKDICKKNNAALKENEIKKDVLNLVFLVDYKTKNKIERLQSDIVDAFDGLTEIQRKILFTGKYSTIREVDVYESGVVIIDSDYTSDDD